MSSNEQIGPSIAPLRTAIRGIDFVARKIEGVRKFDDSGDCLLRISHWRNKSVVHLSDGTSVPRGAAVIELHLWNEHLAISRDGLDLRRGASGRRQLQRSLARLALYLTAEPTMREIQAITLAPAFIRARQQKSLRQLLHLLGAGWTPVSRPLSFVEQLHAILDSAWLWLLLWTFNPHGATTRHFLRHRQEFWISRRKFIALYLPNETADTFR